MDLQLCDGIGIDSVGDFVFCDRYIKNLVTGILCRFNDNIILLDDASYTTVTKLKYLSGAVRNVDHFIIYELVYE